MHHVGITSVPRTEWGRVNAARGGSLYGRGVGFVRGVRKFAKPGTKAYSADTLNSGNRMLIRVIIEEHARFAGDLGA